MKNQITLKIKNMILREDQNLVKWQSRLHSLCEIYFETNKTEEDFIKIIKVLK